MKSNIINIFWGVVLIALGGLFLADRLGYVNLELITGQGWGSFLPELFPERYKELGLAFPCVDLRRPGVDHRYDP
jgi:hypothetical protein